MGQAPQAPPQEQELLPFFLLRIFATITATTAAMINVKIMTDGQFIWHLPLSFHIYWGAATYRA